MQLWRSLIEQGCRGRSTQPLKVEGGEVCTIEWGRVSSPNSGHQNNWLALQPASDERQRTHAGVVKPLCIVDDQDNWARVRGVTHELERGKRDAKWIRLKFSAHAERGVDRSSLGFRQVFGQPDNGMQELVQPGEGELSLRFDPDRGEDTASPGPDALSGALQQRRLADPRFATHDQRPAGIGKAVDKLVEEP